MAFCRFTALHPSKRAFIDKINSSAPPTRGALLLDARQLSDGPWYVNACNMFNNAMEADTPARRRTNIRRWKFGHSPLRGCLTMSRFSSE